MKLHELFYLIGNFFIIISITIYVLSTTMIANPEENSASSLLGKTMEIDTTFTIEETLSELGAKQRQENMSFLWIGIPPGIVLLLAGIIIKRRKEGRDLFIDDDFENNEDTDFPLL